MSVYNLYNTISNQDDASLLTNGNVKPLLLFLILYSRCRCERTTMI